MFHSFCFPEAYQLPGNGAGGSEDAEEDKERGHRVEAAETPLIS